MANDKLRNSVYSKNNDGARATPPFVISHYSFVISYLAQHQIIGQLIDALQCLLYQHLDVGRPKPQAVADS